MAGLYGHSAGSSSLCEKLLAEIQQASDLGISKLEIETILRRSGMQFSGKAAASL